MSAIVQYSPDQIALIKRTVAQGATDDELNLFIYDCQRRNIHPLDKLLHFTKRKGKYVPITSIDLMRSRAAETGQMAGSDDAVFYTESVKPGERHPPEFATVTVYRITQGQRFAYTATARWTEYYPGNGDPGFMWRKMPYVMLAKCAEALALRKAFPQELAGLYAKEEMDQADVPAQRTPPKPGPNVLLPHSQAEDEYGKHGIVPQGFNPVTPSPTPEAAETQPESVASSGDGLTPPMPPIATEAYKVASEGLVKLERWWQTLSKSEQKQLVPYKDMLKGAAAEADAS